MGPVCFFEPLWRLCSVGKTLASPPTEADGCAPPSLGLELQCHCLCYPSFLWAVTSHVHSPARMEEASREAGHRRELEFGPVV